jgi:hypothetical protein
MKTYALLAVALLVALACHAQPAPTPSRPSVPLPALPPPGSILPPPPSAVARTPANYLIRVEWKEPKGETKFLEVLTAEGHVELDTLQKNSVKINNADVPVTLKLNATLTPLNNDKGRLQLFLGRTVPYITGTSGSGPSALSTYSQMSVGLESTFLVKFGTPEVIQTDENGKITVVVKRMED